jgi:5-oxoprolinase (ATP-hydrolysing)
MRRALGHRTPGRFRARETLDDGSPIVATIDVADGAATIDFAGTAGLHPGNLNAPPAVTRSAVLYVLRLLIGRPLPLNEGMLAPIDLRIPPGMLNPPFPKDLGRAPAVVGGNVETSQRVVDTLLKALGLAACSQGTMNNVLFGNERFGYYETLCGGCGAGPGFDGATAVHSHMTNTAITDPEVLEHRYPVRLERFQIRSGSGGQGRFQGGDGVIRELRFLAPVTLSILSQHRTQGPYGFAGGRPGDPGRQWVVRADGRREALPGMGHCQMAENDRLIIETPGGGGWGDPST